jgi:hypothetical protein
LLIDDLQQAVKFLSGSRARHSVGREEAGGYHHT